jgi:hypothetical protein
MATFVWRNEFGPGRIKELTIKKADGSFPVHRRMSVLFEERQSDHRLHFTTTDPTKIALITATEPYLRDRIYWEDFHSQPNVASARPWIESFAPVGSIAQIASKLPFLPISADPDGDYDAFHDPNAPVKEEEPACPSKD